MAPTLLPIAWYAEGETILEEPLVVSCFCAFGQIDVRPGQNAGRAFFERYEKPRLQPAKKRQDEDGEAGQDNRAETDREKAFREKREKKQRESKGKDGGLLKMSDELKGKDLYELLEIEAGCSPEEIKKSYRKLVLVHHPDKMTDPTEAQKKHFLHIQEAFEIISDPDKKRRYESTLDFDDSVPTNFGKGKLADADFYKTFRPVFKRNARWSAKSKVPDLGDADTPIEAVKDFYDFWYDFETWRDPLAMAEKEDIELHTLEEAECREERRWMERENAKVARKLGQVERDRINSLVKTAEKNDPRMIQYKEDQRLEKEAAKAQRFAAEQAEKDRKEAEAKAKKEAAEAKQKELDAKRAEEKKKRDEVKNALKTARQRLRSIHKNANAMVRHHVHHDQLQEVCLRLETEGLHEFCNALEVALKKPGASFGNVIKVMHTEITKHGMNPISDPTVDPTGKGNNSATSTASGESGDEADPSELDSSPVKPPRELTPEELEAERLRKEAEEVAERARQERKAEEQRKRKEQQRKEEEKRQAALRKADKKENEAKKKEEAKEQKKREQDEKKAEEQRQRQLQMKEEQRLQALQEEEEKRRQHTDGLLSRAFEADRAKRIAIIEAYDDGLIEQAFRSTLLQESSESPNLRLQSALKRISTSLPAAPKNKVEAADQARKEVEELCLDAAVACLAMEGGAGASPEDARARLASAVALGVRPPQSAPELSKETKASVKKQRSRVRAVALALLKSFQPVDSTASDRVVGTEAPKPEAVVAGSELVISEDTQMFESIHSYEIVEEIGEGRTLIAAGAPEEVEGYNMVPIRPEGAVELRVVRLVTRAAPKAAPKGAAAKSGGKAAAKPAKDPELNACLSKFVRLATAGPSATEQAGEDFREACFGTFDPEAVLAEPQAVFAAVEVEAPVEEQAAEAQPTAAQGKKKKGAKEPKAEEDLDALLQEFGMANQGGGSKKKKGKK